MPDNNSNNDITGYEASEHMELRLAALRRNFIDRLWTGFLGLVAIGVPISISRAFDTGWLPVYSMHIGLGILVCLVNIFRKRIAYPWLSGLFILLLWLVGLPGIVTFGLAASSVLWLLLSCLIASYLFNVRVALYVALGSAVFIAIIGWAMITGRLRPAVNLDAYVLLPSAWATMLFATGAFIFFIIRSVGAQNETLVHLLQEVDEQRRIIERSATHDQLTGLPTLSLVEDRLSIAISTAQREQSRVGVLFIDLDGFKEVNDRYGHDVGDGVLRQAASRMSGCVRGCDTVARIGGDEFLIVATQVHQLANLESLATKIISAVGAPFIVANDAVTIGASVGIAVYPDHSTSAADLRRIADLAMYEAKRQGKGACRFAVPPTA